MASLKNVKTKIGAIKKTSQITKAMNMVAASKLRGAQAKMEAFRPYAREFQTAMASLAGQMSGGQFALMEAREVKAVEILVVTSDRGLCGSFNSNIFKQAEARIRELEKAGKTVSIVAVGRKANIYFRKTGRVRKAFTDIMGTFQMYNARAIAQDVAANFLAGGADAVELMYGRFINVATQRPAAAQFLPIQPPAAEAGATRKAADYIFEPSPEEIMGMLLPLYLNVMVYHAMLETSTSEHAARMSAMDNATRACKDMAAALTLSYNKARQAGITAELMDIVGGAEALRKA
ncbi:MAG: ATP synthase F1 subunit gamma [Thermodesulfobacteriota bacterium]